MGVNLEGFCTFASSRGTGNDISVSNDRDQPLVPVMRSKLDDSGQIRTDRRTRIRKSPQGIWQLSAVGHGLPSPGQHTNPHLFEDPSRCPPLLFELQEFRIAGRAMCDVLPHLVLREFLPKGNFANRRILRAPYTVGVGIVRQDCVPNRLPKTVVFLLRCICHRSMPLWQLGNGCARPPRPNQRSSEFFASDPFDHSFRISARTHVPTIFAVFRWNRIRAASARRPSRSPISSQVAPSRRRSSIWLTSSSPSSTRRALSAR